MTRTPFEQVKIAEILVIVRKVYGRHLIDRQGMKRWWKDQPPEVQEQYLAAHAQGRLALLLRRERNRADV